MNFGHIVHKTPSEGDHSIVLSYTFFVKSHPFILITCPYHLSVFLFTHSTIPHSIPTAVSLIPHLPYVASLLSLSHLDTPQALRM